MRHAYIVIPVLILLAACGSPKEQAQKKIQAMEQNDSALNNPKQLEELEALYVDYISKYPDDPKTGDYTFKAASSLNTLGKFQEAIDMYDAFIKKNPEDKRVEDASFIKGFIYENGLQQLGKAQEVYKEFLTKYPNSEFADDVKFSLENMGKSGDEIFKKFEEQTPDSVS